MFAGAAVFVPAVQAIEAQVTIKRSPSGFNLFSVQQDVDLGRQSAVEVERQLPVLNDARVNSYLTRIISRLSAQAPGTQFSYTIKAVNSTEINAFALPGGPMYVNRGLVTAARSEAELAGVLAHEMSHVVLRHGTEQASKAYLGQAGLSLLGGLVGKRGSTSSQIINAVGGFGLNAAFLKFSRSDEYEADALGAELMSKAGYDPLAMATMFAMPGVNRAATPANWNGSSAAIRRRRTAKAGSARLPHRSEPVAASRSLAISGRFNHDSAAWRRCPNAAAVQHVHGDSGSAQ
jgi:predicted Zn-dependent protease